MALLSISQKGIDGVLIEFLLFFFCLRCLTDWKNTKESIPMHSMFKKFFKKISTEESSKNHVVDKSWFVKTVLIISILWENMRKHTGEKPFHCGKCSTCSKSFRDLNALNIRVKTHTGQKPFQCLLHENIISTLTFVSIF